MKTKELKHLQNLRSHGAFVALRNNEPLEVRSLKPLTPWRRVRKSGLTLTDLIDTTREFRRAAPKWKYYNPFESPDQLPAGKFVRYYRKTDTQLKQPFILIASKFSYSVVDGALIGFTVMLNRPGETVCGVDTKTLFRKFVFDHAEWRSDREAPKHVSECRVCGTKVIGGAP